MQIRSRSGLACKQELIILNQPVTIDCDYRGEVLTCIKNIGNKTVLLKKADRFAQACLKKVYNVEFEEVSDLTKTGRNNGGFGSTGK